MLRIEKFDHSNYADLISWVDSEEMLMQFAGPGFTYPLTPTQLDISLSDPNRVAFRIVDVETNIFIGHAEIYVSGNSVRLGRILIGNKEQRGKGLGQYIVNLLLAYAFSNSGITKADLNVFDWNTSAIRCYEKVGFSINPGKKLERKLKDKVWIAINMEISRKEWEETQGNMQLH